MLQIKNLTLTHKKDLREILSDFSCVFNNGDKAVIIGEEGNGKSTLLKWLYDPLMVEEYCEAEGERLISGEVLGYLAQELPKEDQQKSVYEFFSEQESFWNQTPKELNQKAVKFHIAPDIFLQGAANEHAFWWREGKGTADANPFRRTNCPVAR